MSTLVPVVKDERFIIRGNEEIVLMLRGVLKWSSNGGMGAMGGGGYGGGDMDME